MQNTRKAKGLLQTMYNTRKAKGLLHTMQNTRKAKGLIQRDRGQQRTSFVGSVPDVGGRSTVARSRRRRNRATPTQAQTRHESGNEEDLVRQGEPAYCRYGYRVTAAAGRSTLWCMGANIDAHVARVGFPFRVHRHRPPPCAQCYY